MTKLELKKLLKKHTKLQDEANKIEREIANLLNIYCPNSELLFELGCLSVTEPSNYEKRAYKELEVYLK